MELPQNLFIALRDVDEDYLIGISNKGIVNRGKKDLSILPKPKVRLDGEKVYVKWEEVECLIKVPLGESTCSCPSGSICRHRISSILWLKENKEQSDEEYIKNDSCDKEIKFKELYSYPNKKLISKLGIKQLESIIYRLEKKLIPEIRKTSVITVDLPWIPVTVRLLEPIEHSTCTCHSNSFCVHKVQALLYFKFSEGFLEISELKKKINTNKNLNAEEVKRVCNAVKDMLSSHITIGLSRISDTICETVERMASLCHTSKLPNLERALHRLHQEYSAYFDRSSQYRDNNLLHYLAHAFILAEKLEYAEGDRYIKLAGEFKDEYMINDTLHLYLLTRREYSNRSGYSGSIYYFWDIESCRFYTLHRFISSEDRNGISKEDSSPIWNMTCTLQQSIHYSMDLTGAKVTSTGKLSSTEQCNAFIKEMKNPWEVIPNNVIFTDFKKLLLNNSSPNLSENDRLVFIYPKKCVLEEYDTIRQVFSMRLLDENGRDLYLEVRYQSYNNKIMNWIEHISKEIEKLSKKPMFIGMVYRENSKLKLYPIDIIIDWMMCNE